MTVTLAQVEADCGEIYTAVNNGTTAVTSTITRATNIVNNVGGAATDDVVIRPLTDALVCNQVIGGVDSVNKTIGTLSVGDKDMKSMQNYFQNEARIAAVAKSYSIEGLTILFTDSEQ